MTLSITTGRSGSDFSGGNNQPATRQEMNERNGHASVGKSRPLGSGCALALTPRLLTGLLFLGSMAPHSLLARPDAASTAAPPDRCLIIVETSRSMQPRADAVIAAVRNLVTSGLNAQLQKGDTLGMWTFNEDLYAGRFPLQTWSPQAGEEITQRAVAFLKAQKYEKQARFSEVVPALSRVIRDSELITVILISSGDEKIEGTLIDGAVNEYFSRWRKQQQKAQIPFVMVWRAKNGALVDCSFNTALWPLQMPRLAVERQTPETAAKARTEAASETPAPGIPSANAPAKGPQPEGVSTAKSEPAVGKVEAPPILKTAATTNEPVKAKPPEAAASQVEMARAKPPPPAAVATADDVPVEAKPPGPAAFPVEIPEAVPAFTSTFARAPDEPVETKRSEPTVPPIEPSRPELPSTVAVKTITNEPVKPTRSELAAPPAVAAKAGPPADVTEKRMTNSVPEAAPALTSAAQPKQELPSAPRGKSSEPAPAKSVAAAPPPAPTPTSEPATLQQLNLSPAPQRMTVTAPPAAAAHEDKRTNATSPVATQIAPATTLPVGPPPSSSPRPPIQSATAIPAVRATSNLNILAAGLVLAGAAAVTALLLARRSHPVPQGSLITRSFQREKKP